MTYPRTIQQLQEGKWIRTICDQCYNSCGILVRVVDGLAVDIRGDPENPNNLGKICAKGQAALMTLYDPYRVKTPLKRTNPQKGVGVDPGWVEISWEEALNTIATKLKKIREEDPRKLLMLQWDAPGGEIRQIFDAAFGTPNRATACKPSCGMAAHGLGFQYHAAWRQPIDIAYCNYAVLFGSQQGTGVDSMAPRAMQAMAKAKARGMKLVVVDPRFSDAAKIADEWLPIRPCTDGALVLTWINLLLNELNVYDGDYLRKYTNGPYLIGPDGLYVRDKQTSKPLMWDSIEGKAKTFDADVQSPALEGNYEINGVKCNPAFQLLREHVKKYTPQMASEVTTLPADTIRRMAGEIAKAAQIGSKIVIEDNELPLRPFGLHWHKGGASHKYSFLIGFSFKLLSVVLGALDVPGGVVAMPSVFGPLNTVGQCPDGLMTKIGGYGRSKYPVHKSAPPARMDLYELMPAGWAGNVLIYDAVANPEKYKIPYHIEMIIHNRNSPMTNTINLEQISKFFTVVPFVVSMNTQLDETAEMADIVLPDVHNLESLVFFPNAIVNSAGTGHWWFFLMKPVVEPSFKKAPFKIRHSCDILYNLAERVGFLPDIYEALNLSWDLKGKYRLDLSRKYDLEEILDHRARNMFGDEHGLDWFKEHGILTLKKTIKQAYSRLFHSARVPIYFEDLLRAKEDQKGVIDKLGIQGWDFSEYRALPDWLPCPTYDAPKEYDLYAVNFRVATHALTVTANNPWLIELTEHRHLYDVRINTETARKKGIQDGDYIRIESSEGFVIRGAKVRLTEAIHPEVIGIPGVAGLWAKGRPLAKGHGVHFSSLIPLDVKRAGGVYGCADSNVRVKIMKEE